MRNHLKHSITFLWDRLGLKRFLKDERPPSVRIVYYHDVPKHQEHHFQHHLEYLSQAFRIISLDEAVMMLSSPSVGGASSPASARRRMRRLRGENQGLPDECLVVTFDDGLCGVLSVAAPLLKRYQVPATFFVIPGFADGCSDSYLSWEQVKALLQMGFDIGSHTLTHRRLSTLTKDEAKNELVRSKEAIERETGREVKHFAFPFGDFTQELKGLVREAGYASASTAVRGGNTPRVDVFALHRDHLEASYPLHTVRFFLEGGYEALCKLTGRRLVKV